MSPYHMAETSLKRTQSVKDLIDMMNGTVSDPYAHAPTTELIATRSAHVLSCQQMDPPKQTERD